MPFNSFQDYPHAITVIDTHYYRKKLAASHLIIHEGKAAFVDVGTTPALKHLLGALEEKQLGPKDVSYIILTHIHLDHAGCAGALLQHCPNASLVVHPKGAGHIIDPEKLVNATIAIYGKELFLRLYKEIVPVSEERIVIAEEGLVLDFHGRKLHFLDTPGHARHHCCIWDPESKGVFTGDTLGIAYPELQVTGRQPFHIPTTSPVGFEPEELKKSIGRLQELNPELFYLAHYGPVVNNPDAVDNLFEMIDKHAELGRTDSGDPEALRSNLFNLYYQSYCSYTGKKVKLNKFKSVVAGDLELNAQGIETWVKRQNKA